MHSTLINTQDETLKTGNLNPDTKSQIQHWDQEFKKIRTDVSAFMKIEISQKVYKLCDGLTNISQELIQVCYTILANTVACQRAVRRGGAKSILEAPNTDKNVSLKLVSDNYIKARFKPNGGDHTLGWGGGAKGPIHILPIGDNYVGPNMHE